MIVNLNNPTAFSSTNLYHKIQLLSSDDITKIQNGIIWIHKNLKNTILIGGTAVVNYLQSGRDLTPDLDYLFNNFESLSPILEYNNLAYQNLLDFNNQTIGITIPSLNIDILNKTSIPHPLHKLIISDYQTTIIGNVECKVIAIELLIIQKILLGRNKDLDDAISLIQQNKLDKIKLNMYLKELKKYNIDCYTVTNFINSFKSI